MALITFEEGEALIIRGAFLATALGYYLAYRLHRWATERREGRAYETPAGIPVVFQMSNGIPAPPRWDDTPAKFAPEPVFKDDDGEFDAWAYVEPEGPNWPGAAKVTVNPRKIEK